MTYQPLPTGGGRRGPSPQFEVAQARREARSRHKKLMAERPPKPRSLRNAVRLMWAGAALYLFAVIAALAFNGRMRTELINSEITANHTAAREHKAQFTTAQIHTLANATFVLLVAFGLVCVLLWLWMAWANNRGTAWARIVATVLFGLNTLLPILVLVLSGGGASLSSGLQWLVAARATRLLWRWETTEYINFGRQR